MAATAEGPWVPNLLGSNLYAGPLWKAPSMLLIRLAATAGTLAMAAMIVYGFVAGSFGAEGEQILGLPWGQVTLVDLYVALLLGWLWIAWRERSTGRAAAWLAAVIVLGSLALAGYVALASGRDALAAGRG
jgi:hypothetical protein